MDIKGFIEASFVDWNGKICSVLFLSGCNFRCPFCHNVNLVLEPEKLDAIPLEYLKEKLKEQKEWIDGICITGGEPTINKDLVKLCSTLKNMGFLIKLDTNGTNPVILKELIDKKLVNYVAMDIKAPLNEKNYSEATGVKIEKNLNKINQSIELLKKSNIDYEFRTTVVPTLHTEEEMEKFLESAQKIIPNTKRR
ncbi:MAG: anaerobic ribonucleoside-triphosphate reductase activating protein [Candidatus Bathyarchaeota archaeon]